MDSRSEAVLAQVHPRLATTIRALCGDLFTRFNSETEVTQGYRTWPEQHALFLKRPPVTKADQGYSMHNFGLAVDLCPSKIDGLVWTPDWDGTDAHYAHMVAAGVAHGLNCGANWHTFKDEPHFQLAGIPTTPTDAMRALMAAKGIAALWAAVDAGEFNL